jgi:hypothetical protein
MELVALEQRLRASTAAYAGGDTEGIADGLKQLSAGDGVVRLLAALRSDLQRLAAAASRSYLHANGFVKIVLLAGDGFKLRLHLWMPDRAGIGSEVEDIHNHRWDFASHMLTGGYRYQQFAPASDGTSYFGYSYRSPEGDNSFALRTRGAKLLSCVFDAAVDTGTSYTLRAEVLHRVISDPGRLTATLMLQGAPRRPATEVYTTTDLGRYVSVPIASLSPEGLDHRLRTFAEYLRIRS